VLRIGSTHAPSQCIHVLGQVQVPSMQPSPRAHAWPHAAQLVELAIVSTHPSAHDVSPTGQVHVPDEHVPFAHDAPHAPQCRKSYASETHASPQNVCPASHAHIPSTHV
jgi:hypothetical protein